MSAEDRVGHGMEAELACPIPEGVASLQRSHGRRPHRAPTPWLSDVESMGLRDVERLPTTVDVAVIGGGVIGVAIAYWLARSGTNVLLLDARQLGWGASGRNAGLVLGSPSSLQVMRSVLAEEEIDAGYHEPGHLALAASDAMMDRFRCELASRPASASPVHLLDRSQCETLLATRLADRFVGGRWMPVAGAVDPARLVYGLAAAAVRHGADVATGTSVSDLQPQPPGGWRLATTRGTVDARHAVLACNARSVDLWPPLRPVLWHARGQALATRALAPVFRLGMAVDYGAVYWRQMASGSVVIGGLQGVDPTSERNTRESLNPRIQAALTRFLGDAFPDLPPVRVTQRWAGIMDQTRDGLPIVGRWPAQPGLWVAVGFGGHGLPPALSLGRALAQAIVTDEPQSELKALVPDRFSKTLTC